MSETPKLIYRNSSSSERKQPSPTELQAMLSQWEKWKAAHPSILDMGDALLPTGKAITPVLRHAYGRVVARLLREFGAHRLAQVEEGLAPTFAQTRRADIVSLYERLARVEPSPLHTLHGAIARSYAEGPAVALAQLQVMRPPTWLAGSHLWLATFADFHRRLGDLERARSFYAQAIALAPPFERGVLERRLQALSG